MKVLFAIGNAQTSKSVADKFYQTYGELLEYKDVFYFRALLEEVKKDKGYNVIVISEDVEPMKAITIEEIDDAIFRNIDNLTDEVQDASIVFIGSDRRNKTDSLVNRLYSIGIYSMLLGNDRNITSLCDVIKEPRTKKEAKDYLNLNPSASGTTNSQVLKEDEIKEDELAHILKHYEKLGNDTSKYIPAFESIEEQFTKKQLMTIAAAISVYLPSIVADTISQDPRYEQMFRAVSTKKGAKQNKNNAVQQPKNPAKKSGILNFLSGKRDKKDKMASASQQIIDESARLQEQEEEKARLAAKQSEEEAQKLREESERQAKLEIERIKHETEQRMAKEAAEVAKKKEEERKAQEAAAKYAHEQEILKQRTLNVQKNRVEAERGTNFEKLMNIASGADDINIDISGLEDKKLKVEANKQAEMQ